jgi:catechol 2,3-dioxygenase-like lactoylglutathione lyase family enzyme
MKRLHIHLGVENIEASIAFYSALFGQPPVKVKADYAKWLLADPRLNFAISTRAKNTGVDHLGIQVDSAEELETLRTQLAAAELATHSEGETVCCYMRSEKSWLQDPNGLAWEAYHSMAEAQVFSEATAAPTACCVPQAADKKDSCC